jgi:hypothetical protein
MKWNLPGQEWKWAIIAGVILIIFLDNWTDFFDNLDYYSKIGLRFSLIGLSIAGSICLVYYVFFKKK